MGFTMKNIEEATIAAKERALHLNKIKEKKIVKLIKMEIIKNFFLVLIPILLIETISQFIFLNIGEKDTQFFSNLLLVK